MFSGIPGASVVSDPDIEAGSGEDEGESFLLSVHQPHEATIVQARAAGRQPAFLSSWFPLIGA